MSELVYNGFFVDKNGNRLEVVDAAARETAANAVNASQLSQAVENALTVAKNSGEFDGADGFSPSAKVEETENGAVITITDKSGTTTATVASGGGNGSVDTGYVDTAVNNAINALEIGGRNLVPNSEGPLDLVSDPAGRIILQGDYRGTFTFAADVTKGPNDTATNTRIQCTIYYTDGTTEDLRAGYDYNNTERDGITRRKTLTFTTREGAEVRRLVLVPVGFSSQGEKPRDASAERIKLERGTKATDWTPNPDDTKNAIEQIQARIENHSLMIEALQDQLDELNLEWTPYFNAIWYRLLTLERHLNLQKPAGTEPPVSDEDLDENFSGA